MGGAAMSNLDDWIMTVALDLGLATNIDRDLVLDLARDVAHGVARPAAPITTFLLGMAVGAGGNPHQLAERIQELAAGWAPDDAPPPETTLID
jgi:hypothetical protein